MGNFTRKWKFLPLTHEILPGEELLPGWEPLF